MTTFTSEKSFTRWVLKAARERGWQAAHFGSSVRYVARGEGNYAVIPDRDATGFPDVVLVRERLIFAELKLRASHGRLSPPQREWLSALRRADAEVHLWYSDQQDEVLAILDGGDVSGTRLFDTGRTW